MTPREFQYALQGFYQHHEETVKVQAELMRGHAMRLISPHLKKGATIHPDQFWPMPWDEKKFETSNVQVLTDEQAIERLRKMHREYKKQRENV